MLVAARRSCSTACLAMPYGSSGSGPSSSCIGTWFGAVHGDRRGEHEALDVVVHAGVDQVDAADQVVLVVEAPDEVAEPLGGVGGQVVDALERGARRRAARPARWSRMLALDELSPGVNVLGEAAAEVVEHDDVRGPRGGSGDVRADEAGPAGD